MIKLKALAVAAAAVLCVAATPDSKNVDQLSWLAGHWTSDKDGQSTEESWLAPRGGSMLGVGRTSDAAKVHFWELLRIETGDDGVVTYWGAPMGGSPTPFRLTRAMARDALFENPKHDFPTRIHYRRDGKYLYATISGPDGANAQTVRYRLVR